MPFTPAHAAAALPFLRTRLVPSAVIVGTMAPDFEYFLRFAPGGGFGHTIPGAFLLSLPLALIVLWIFHVVIKDPLVRLFPDGIRLRIAAQALRFRFGGPGRFILVALSALIGIATHLVWDLFTHHNTWAYFHFPWLRRQVILPILGPNTVATVLQMASTVFGMLLLSAWFWRWYRVSVPARSDKGATLPASRRYMVLVGIAMIACAGGAIRAALVGPEWQDNWVVRAGDGVSTAIALAWWMLVFYAAVPARRWSRVRI